jgi:hypothetical protein
MNVKKRWISNAIVLAVYLLGFCNAQVLAGVKNNYQARRTVDLSALTFHTTFSEAIDILRNSAEPPLKIVVLWKDLSENAYVEPDTPIKIDLCCKRWCNYNRNKRAFARQNGYTCL